MIKQQHDYISPSEFERLCREGNVICILAQSLADEAMGEGYKLSHRTDFIRQRYVDLAQSFMNKLSKRNLTIIYTNKDGELNDTQN